MTSPFMLDPDISRFLPKEAVFAARTDLSQIRLLGLNEVNADTMTLSLFGLLGRMQTIRHMSGVTDEILGFLSDADLNIEEQILPFDNKTKAVDLARLKIKQGHRIFQIYPFPQGTYQRSALIVPPALWYDLNSKAKLRELVPEEHLASRRIGSSADLRHSGFTGPAWLKLGGPAATGFGHGVRRCVDKKSFLEAIDAIELLGRGQKIVVEDDVPITESWCANIIVGHVRQAGVISWMA